MFDPSDRHLCGRIDHSLQERLELIQEFQFLAEWSTAEPNHNEFLLWEDIHVLTLVARGKEMALRQIHLAAFAETLHTQQPCAASLGFSRRWRQPQSVWGA